MQMDNVTLTEIIVASRNRHASMVPESAGYLLLGVVRAMGGRPVQVDPCRIMLSVDGAVALAGQRKRQNAENAAAALQHLLGGLLEVANGKSNQLRAIVDGATPSLEGLFTGITKALIPINRGAAKRALGRLARETLRAKSRGLVTVEPTATPSPLPALPRRPVAAEPEPPPAPVPALEPAPVVTAPVTVPEPEEAWPDGEIGLATPTPAAAVSIELATPTPAPVATVAEPLPEVEPEPLPLLVLAAPKPFVLFEAPEEEPAIVEMQPAVAEEPRDEEPAPLGHRDAIFPVAAAEVELPVVQVGDEAPFSRVTPLQPVVEESPSPEGVCGGTPTFVDASLYALTTNLSAPDLDGRISALSVDMPPADLRDEEADVEVEFSEEPPVVAKAEEPAKVEEPVEPEPIDALEAEARVAERLLALGEGRLSGRAEPEVKDAVATLLERFGESEDKDAVSEAAASLKRMMALELTPPPPKHVVAVADENADDGLDDAASPLPAMAIDPGARLTPTRLTLSPARRSRVAWLAGSGALLLSAAALGYFVLRNPGLVSSHASAPAPAELSACYADLALKDLPAPHEVLVRLGEGSFTTRSLPTGVRLELLAMAPGHRPKRVLVPADAEWIEGADGSRSLALAITLEAGDESSWPAAPAGDVGGMGPRGTIDVTVTPSNAEVWLVAGAGNDARGGIAVPCESAANLLVVNPREPAQQRRLSVGPELLAAAVRAGGAELSVKP
jgi:hypothetical protein